MADENGRWRRQDEAFWRAHHEAWKHSDLNQRQYCEAERIPLKAFGNWRAVFKAEPQPPERKLLYRSRGLSPPFSPQLSPPFSPTPSPGLIPPLVRQAQSLRDHVRVIGADSVRRISARFSIRPRKMERVPLRSLAVMVSMGAFCADGSKNRHLQHLSPSRSPMRRS